MSVISSNKVKGHGCVRVFSVHFMSLWCENKGQAKLEGINNYFQKSLEKYATLYFGHFLRLDMFSYI